MQTRASCYDLQGDLLFVKCKSGRQGLIVGSRHEPQIKFRTRRKKMAQPANDSVG